MKAVATLIGKECGSPGPHFIAPRIQLPTVAGGGGLSSMAGGGFRFRLLRRCASEPGIGGIENSNIRININKYYLFICLLIIQFQGSH